MIDWVKLQVGIATNAKVARAGSDGALVFMAALLQHARHGRAGRVPAHRLDPWTLKVEAVAFFGAWAEDRVAAAVETCCDAGLLRRDNDAIVLCGYDAESMPQCVRCRQPNDDHRYATCATCRETRSKDHGRNLSRHVSRKSRHGTPDRTGQDNTPLPPESRASRGGASASRRGDPEPERATRAPESLRPDPAPSVQPTDDRAAAAAVPIAAGASDEVLQLQDALMQSRYRSSMVPMRRRFAMRREAERLVATGLDVPQFEQLAELAAEHTNGDDGALLAHWLDGEPPRWREVLDEQAARSPRVRAPPNPANRSPPPASSTAS